MLDSAFPSEHAAGNEDGAWLVGFPLVAFLVLVVVVQTALMPITSASMATGVCQQTGASEAAFRALMLH